MGKSPLKNPLWENFFFGVFGVWGKGYIISFIWVSMGIFWTGVNLGT